MSDGANLCSSVREGVPGGQREVCPEASHAPGEEVPRPAVPAAAAVRGHAGGQGAAGTSSLL